MTERERVLLTGATGYLGRYLLAQCQALGHEVVTAGRSESAVTLDLADPASCRAVVAAVRPAVILHAAAMSTMFACERDPERSQRVNADCVAELIEGKARFWFVSTDLVFDGRGAPYRASDPVSPLSVYARTKVFGEMHTLGLGGGVIRLPLLFGQSHEGTRGATDMVRHALREGRSLTLFADEFRTPLHVADAARAIVSLSGERANRVLHVAGPERISRYELGVRFATAHGLPVDGLRAVPSNDPMRPRDVSLVRDLPLARDLDAMLRDS